MKTIWRGAGILAFWVSWPALWIYLRGSARTRVLLRHEGKILIVKNWLGSGQWALPGGGLHSGEPALIGARRELNEELGLQNVKLTLKPLAIEAHTGKGFTYICHYFVIDLKKLPDIKMQRFEIIEYAWVLPSQLDTTNANPDLLRALFHAG